MEVSRVVRWKGEQVVVKVEVEWCCRGEVGGDGESTRVKDPCY